MGGIGRFSRHCARQTAVKFESLKSITEVSAHSWNTLTGAQTPFTRHEFLHALEDTGCSSGASGWEACHLVWKNDNQLAAALPLYRKHHSYGEYVFDWSWADAYHQAGLDYYPKLLCAIPFTPVPGPRLLFRSDLDAPSLMAEAINWVKEQCTRQNLSSFHLLFPDANLLDACNGLTLLKKETIQFHWTNRDFTDFDHFLSQFRSSKRKQIRRERRRVLEQDIQIRRLTGAGIDSNAIDFFVACYQDTYLKRSGHRGYLNADFFHRLRETMADQIALVIAEQGDEPLASALFFYDNHQLYGRYWGSLQDVDCLHFEVCYYQGIELCIEMGLQRFNPGTQGEHKLVRGFEPTRTQSLHWLANSQFQAAVDLALRRESAYTKAYEEAARSHLPFRNTG